MSDERNNSDGEAGRKEAAASNGWHVVDLGRLKNPPEWFAAGIYVLAAIIGVGALIVGIAAFFVFGYEMFVGETKDRLEAAKVFFPVLVAIIGGPVLIWRALTAHWAAQAARKQADTDREGFYTDVFTKAVEQLGATREVIETVEPIPIGATGGKMQRETITKTEPNFEVRLGAIYALERVAQDSERDHWPIMEVLCAYVRNPKNSGDPVLRRNNAESGTDGFSSWLHSFPPLRDDIQAAITVIGRRDSSRVQYEKSRTLRLDFSGANLQKANFEAGDFSGAIFNKTHLEWTFFTNANLEGSLFMEARCDLAHFDGIDFRNVEIDGGSFNNTIFSGSNLEGVSFDGCDLRYAMLRGARMDGVSFFDTDLSRTLIDESQLANTLGDSQTILPRGISAPTNWPSRHLTSEERMAWMRMARAKEKSQ